MCLERFWSTSCHKGPLHANKTEGKVTTFLDEVTILHRLTESPYVIQLLGLCTDPGHYAIVMEYVENGDLEEMLISDNSKHSKIREWSCRRKMSLHIAKGMDFLHSLKPPIIHRDLKTSNVVVDRNYCCKIIDFGLSVMREISKQSTKLSISSSRKTGTVAFTAPEVFWNRVDKKRESKIDVYSYSIILWQIREMKRIYDGFAAAVIRANVMGKQRPHLSDNDRSEGFRGIIIRCWNDEPDVRLDFREIITMLQGITRQTCASCSEDGVLRRDSTVTALHTDNAIDSISIQSDAHTNATSLASIVPNCQSAETLILESTSLNPTAPPFNPVLRSVSDEKKTDRQRVISSSKNVGNNTWRARQFQKSILVIDTERHGESALVTLTPQKTWHLPRSYKVSRVYRITGIKESNTELQWSAKPLHLTDVVDAAKEVLTAIRREADEASTHNLRTDIWVQLGRQLVFDVNDSVVDHSYSIESVVSNINMEYKKQQLGKWRYDFEVGLQELDVSPLYRFLTTQANEIRSSTRHDVKVKTPSNRVRRFQVRIPEDQKDGTDSKTVGVDCSQTSLEDVEKAVIFPYDHRLKADVSMPYSPFDCRLFVRTAVGVTDYSKEESEEDAILSRNYFEKIVIDGKDLLLPPKKLLPFRYHLLDHRKREQQTYRYRSFELTVTKEKVIGGVQEKRPQKLDVHIYGLECDSVLQRNEGRDWKPDDVLLFIREMLNCAKTISYSFL
ncbi:uncharacterized protein LOC134184849 isoform X2 [Corticium candelabrum]|uniref:uncharacterized protein LOC134184849 isoform X2 n=1 Tax=Corticium candelabrum TaxID=121492 RepID=UPI002E33AC24|nr:uncharacterized protein LOC134184849 isoform X2 [Corticium candelabrum]